MDRDTTADLQVLANAFFQNLMVSNYEYGGIGVDSKRPFGNSDVEYDILEMLGCEAEGDDGEGSITWHRKAPAIIVYNTCEGLMIWLKNHVDGNYRVAHKAGRLPCFEWHVNSARNCYRLCKAMHRHLVIKDAKARNMMIELEDRYGRTIKD